MSGAVRKFTPEELAELAAFDKAIDEDRRVSTFVTAEGVPKRTDYHRDYYRTHPARQDYLRAYHKARRAAYEAELAMRRAEGRELLDTNPLHLWRTKRGWTYGQAADFIGCCRDSVRNWEKGLTPIPERVMKILEGTT